LTTKLPPVYLIKLLPRKILSILTHNCLKIIILKYLTGLFFKKIQLDRDTSSMLIIKIIRKLKNMLR